MTEQTKIKVPKGWILKTIDESTEILDKKRKPINSKERQDRIEGKNKSELFPYYGATGQVGLIDDYLLDGEFILLGEDGAPFLDPVKDKAYIVRGKIWVNNHAHILKSKTSNKFLKHYLNQFNYYGYVTGTTRLKLNQSSLKSISIPLPQLPEQHRIVAKIEELFSELDKAVENLQTAKKQLKTYRQSVLKHAFEGKLTAQWRKSLKFRVQSSKKEELAVAAEPGSEYEKNGKLPEGWEWKTIGDICSKVEYGSSKKSEKEGLVPVLRMGNIQKGIFDWSDLVYSNDNEEIQKYKLKKNDVLFNRTNSPELVGKTAIYLGEREAIFAGYLIRIHYNDEINPKYLNFFLNSLKAKEYGNTVKTDGVNQSNINGKKLKGYPFPYCSDEEQHQIVTEIENRFTVADKMEESIDKSLKQAETLRQSILKKAFEGRLVPQVEEETNSQ